MTTAEQIKSNIQTILVLCRGLDQQRYQQVAQGMHTIGQLVALLESLGAKSAMAGVLEVQLQAALVKQEQLITELEKLKKNKKAKTTEPEEGETNGEA